MRSGDRDERARDEKTAGGGGRTVAGRRSPAPGAGGAGLALGLIAVALLALHWGGGALPATAQAAPAGEVVFEAVLGGSQAVPPTTTGDIGTARLVLDEARGEIHYRIEFSGLRGRPSAVLIQRAGTADPTQQTLLTLGPDSPADGTWRPGAQVIRDLEQEDLCVVVPTDLHPTGEVRGDLRQLSLASDRATWGRLKAIFSGG